MLDLGDMMTASGLKEETVKTKILDFNNLKIEDNSTRKNLGNNFDTIFAEELEKSDHGSPILPSVPEEKR